MKPIYTPGVNHVMIDIETLDTQPNSPILSIGAVPFALSAQEEIDMFFNLSQYDIPLEYHEHIELPPTIENNGAFRFHIEKKTGAIENSIKHGKPLERVLGNFHEVMTMWAPQGQDYFLWGWGYGFDMTILYQAYRHHSDQCWKNNVFLWPEHVKDYRTQVVQKQPRPIPLTLGVEDSLQINAGAPSSGKQLMMGNDGLVYTGLSPQFSTVGKTWDPPYWLTKYTNHLDARSIYFGLGKTYADMPPRKGTHHDALDDAKHQIRTIQKVYTGEDDECSED